MALSRAQHDAGVGADAGRLAALLEHGAHSIWSADLDGRILFVSPGMVRDLGLNVADVLGQSAFDFVHSEDQPAFREAWSRLVSGTTSQEMLDLRAVTGEGGWSWLRLTITDLRDDPDVRAIGGLAVDINDLVAAREALAASEARYRALADTGTEGIVVLSRTGVVLYANARLAEILGRGLGQVYTLGAAELFDGTDADLIRTRLAEREARGAERYEATYHHPDGRLRILACAVAPIRRADGSHEGSLGMISDITQARRDDLELQRTTEELDRRVEHVGIVAHDLRNPLAIILGMARLLERGAFDRDEGARTEAVQAISDAGRGMATLIDDILAVTRIEAGSLQLARHPLDLRALVERVVQRLALLHEGRELTLLPGPSPLLVEGDAPALERVVLNLLTNALKFSSAPAPVTVSVSAPPGSVVVSVRDAGAGVPAEDRPRLFEKFSRLSSAVGIEGTGLGLFICRSIVEAHGGRIWVEDAVGGGAEFFVSLPGAQVS